MKCKIEGCEGKYKAKGYCAKHYQQLQRVGKVLEKTKFDKNEYTTCGDITFGHIVTEKYSKVFIIDTEDLPRVREHKWHICSTKSGQFLYVNNTNCGALSRFLLKDSNPQLLKDSNPQLHVDHMNHNTLDNRKSNLRVCTNAENSRNRIVKSPYKGVSKNGKRYRARIEVDGNKICLGTYNTPEEASQAYDIAAKNLHKDFALTNSDIKESQQESIPPTL